MIRSRDAPDDRIRCVSNGSLADAPRPRVAVKRGLSPALRGVVLFLHALRLSLKAQRVRSTPIKPIVGQLLATRFLPGAAATDEAERAAVRACNLFARFAGGINTCLTRSLVAGTLLADREGVFLHVGFRTGDGRGAIHEGHAWLTMQGECISDPLDAQAQSGPFVESLRLPLRR